MIDEKGKTVLSKKELQYCMVFGLVFVQRSFVSV